MNCPRCRTLVLSEDVNLEHLLAKCRQCQEVFRFSAEEIEAVTERLQDKITSDVPSIKAPEVRVPRPDGIEVDDLGGERRMVKRWFHPQLIFAAMFCVVWDGFLIFWYTIAFTTDAPWIMVVFPILHLTAGVCLTYSTIAGFFNRTTIEVNDSWLSVSSGPVPWFGNVNISVAAIEQVYCMEIDPSQWTQGQWGRGTWARACVKVSAALRSGRQLVLLASIPRDEGLFIEQQLEEWLEIEPKRVPGQVD